MILDASCQISYHSNAPIPAIMMLRPRSGYAQWITREEYTFEPHAPVVEYTDNFGNLCQRVLIPKGSFGVRCSCRAHTADVVDVEPQARLSQCRSFRRVHCSFCCRAAIASQIC